MSSIPVSKTKIVPPRRRAELLSRKRLLDLLFEALDKKLTLVSAPAGYGKTSLLIDFVHLDELPCCWLSLDELDRDPQRFASYFIAALSERFPAFGAQSKGILEGMNSFEQDMERLLVTLVNELYEQVKEHFVFILDDFHLLENVAPINEFVNRFAQLADDNCHLVISSRRLAELKDMPVFVAKDQVSGLNFADLAFNPGELQALALQNSGGQMSDEEARCLIAEAEGWITGLQFSESDRLRGSSKPSAVGSRANLHEYFGHQVLERQPPDLRLFVLRTALLDEFDAALCESVLSLFYPEPQDWQAWIKAVSNNHLFTLPIGEDGRWLRYHHLFRDYIRERFEREYPGEVGPILTRLQTAYELMGEWAKAHHICQTLGDADALSDLVERAGSSMLISAHLTVENWLNDLPPSMLRTKPGLLSLRGVLAQLKDEFGESLRLLEKAEEMFRKNNDVKGLALTLTRKATSNRFLANYADALQNSEEAIQMTEGLDELQAFHADALRVKGLVLFRLGQASRAVINLEQSLAIHTRLKDTSQVPVLWMETGMAYRAIGDFAQAQTAYEKALQFWRKEGNLFRQASLLNNLGGLYQTLGEYEKSVQAFEEGILCAQRSHNMRLDALISISLGDLYLEIEDFEMSEQNYKHAADVLQRMNDTFLSHSLSISQAKTALLQRDAPLAKSAVENMRGIFAAGGSTYEKNLLRMTTGHLRLLEANPQEAQSEFEKAETRFMEDGREIEAAAARIWRVAAIHRAGNSAEAVRLLNELSGSKKTVNAIVVAVHQARAWLDGVRKNSTLARPLFAIFARAEEFSHKLPELRRQLRRQARVVIGPTPHLIIQSFGQAMVTIDGRVLTNADWQTQSVRELFFYLLSTGSPLSREQIGEALWADKYESSKQVTLRIKNELYRLRRAVGNITVLFENSQYAFNQNTDYRYDVEDFEAYLAQAKSSKDAKEQMDNYERALELAHGNYLADIYADWTLHDRERLRLEQLNALVALADLYQKNARPEAAIPLCQRAIEMDPGWEAAYQVQMSAHGRLNDRASISRVYQSCQEAMRKQFNLPPSRETDELYRRLMR
ncbi:MAG: tetratricopeptide repeat protein [Anaerolineales bacterium]|nr:tetratricopeptide repeat protein [Anaerolineales bacterium]